jgi:chemotaxis protein CheX
MNKNLLDVTQAAIVRSIATDACLEMFATFGSSVELVDRTDSPAHDIASFIGFTGRARGCLTVSSSAELFRASYPAREGTSPSVADLFDWAGEVANQLVGRIKRHFCERGVTFQVSTPTAVKGRDIAKRSPARQGACDLTFTVGSEIIDVSLEVAGPVNGKIFDDLAEPIACVSEGDLVLF